MHRNLCLTFEVLCRLVENLGIAGRIVPISALEPEIRRKTFRGSTSGGHFEIPDGGHLGPSLEARLPSGRDVTDDRNRIFTVSKQSFVIHPNDVYARPWTGRIWGTFCKEAASFPNYRGGPIVNNQSSCILSSLKETSVVKYTPRGCSILCNSRVTILAI
jgi:hypothetical protein